MKRWDSDQNVRVEAPDVDAFLSDILAVYRKHKMTISHEDGHGGFRVVRGFDEGAAQWMLNADISSH